MTSAKVCKHKPVYKLSRCWDSATCELWALPVATGARRW